MDNELADLRKQTASAASSQKTDSEVVAPAGAKSEYARLQAEFARLRDRNAELEERLADVLDDEEALLPPRRPEAGQESESRP